MVLLGHPIVTNDYLGKRTDRDSKNPWSKHTLQFWRKVLKSLHLPMVISSLTGTADLTDISPLSLDSGFQRWSLLPLQYVHQVLKNNQMISFGELSSDFHLPKSDFFSYLQLRDYLLKHHKWVKIKGEPSLIEKHLSILRKGQLVVNKLQNYTNLLQSRHRAILCKVQVGISSVVGKGYGGWTRSDPDHAADWRSHILTQSSLGNG